MRLSTLARLGLCSLFVSMLASCAEERPAINQVEANALAKSFFVGDKLEDPSDDPEFYWRNYVVDGTASQSLVGVGSWSGVDRVRWEITEDLLIARKAYQLSKGADDKGVAARDPNGAIVAAYKIQKHFDIRRAYNPTTGEEQNVVVENALDRTWNQREYMRVDWSVNLVEDPMWTDMFLGKILGNIEVTPLSYVVTSPDAEDAPHFEADKGYFDVTNHFLVSPATSDVSWGTGKVPTCVLVGLYTGSATYDCNAQEAVVRSSYLRIDPKADFEPLENTKAPLDVVGNPGGIGDSLEAGIVTPGQQGWDPGYGYVDKLYHRFAHVHNLWKKSHQDATCADNTDADGNGTADACENAVTGYAGKGGSQCDVFVGKCTIPYRDREVKTIGYWVNKEMPAELQDPLDPAGKPTARGAAEDLAFSWNQLMSNAVANAREVECRRTGDGDRAACHAQFFADQKVMVSYGAWLVDQPKETTPVLTLCHNPVRAYDLHETCGKTGYKARVGDLRHNFLFYWPYESRAPWGGIADWNADPLTGQIIGAAAQIMGRSATYAAALQRDVLQLAMGDTQIEDITDGVPAQNYAHYMANGSTPVALSSAELQKRVKAVDAAKLMSTVAPTVNGASVAERYQSYVEMQKSTSADPLTSSTAQLEYDAIVKPLLGSQAEAQLVDSHWMVGALGMDPATPMDDQVLGLASPLRGLDSGRLSAWRDLVQQKLRLHGVCFMDTEAPAYGSVDMAGLGGYFKKKYGDLDPVTRGEKIYHDLWIEAFKGIAIHEMGHSLGMLHQFASSWDAPNYNPQYWQLRTDEGKASASCNGQPRSGDTDTCMGPRYLDPETKDERGQAAEPRPSLIYFANTSVMEYQIERFGETVGLGTYDQHVMNALYGRVLETMDDDQHGGLKYADQKAFAPRMESQLGEQDRVQRAHPSFGYAAWPTHYTEVARMMKVFDPARDCRDATDEEKARAEWRIVHGKVCAPPPRDHAAWQDFLSDELPSSQSLAPYWHTDQKAKTGQRVRWFYRWGTNHNSYFHTNDSDAGADPYEVTVYTARKFDVGYPWSYFRRQNREYYYAGIPAQVADRYFERIRSFHWLVANSTAFYRSFGSSVYDEIAKDDDWHRPYLVAETEMFNFLVRSVLMPEPGDYASVGTPPGQTHALFDLPDSGSGGASFSVGIVDGRFIGEEFDSDPSGGGSWDYLHWMKHAGFSTEKTLAVRALTDGRPNLFTINRQNFLDGRAVKINFRSDMGPALDRLLGGILAEDWDSVAPWVSPQDGKTPSPRLLDLTADAPARDPGAMILFPNLGYKQQLGALVFAAAFSRLDSDMNLVNKMRIWIDGQVGSINVPPEQQVRFTDPVSGYTYIARKYGDEAVDGKSVDRGIASRMIAHASALLVASYQVQLDGQNKPVLDAYGAPVLALDGNGQPIPLDPDTSKAGDLTRYVGLLDATRQVGHLLGYGPLGGPAGEED
jgi:hypothetical protein